MNAEVALYTHREFALMRWPGAPHLAFEMQDIAQSATAPTHPPETPNLSAGPDFGQAVKQPRRRRHLAAASRSEGAAVTTNSVPFLTKY
jgi:hypothetical protein